MRGYIYDVNPKLIQQYCWPLVLMIDELQSLSAFLLFFFSDKKSAF